MQTWKQLFGSGLTQMTNLPTALCSATMSTKTFNKNPQGEGTKVAICGGQKFPTCGVYIVWRVAQGHYRSSLGKWSTKKQESWNDMSLCCRSYGKGTELKQAVYIKEAKLRKYRKWRFGNNDGGKVQLKWHQQPNGKQEAESSSAALMKNT